MDIPMIVARLRPGADWGWKGAYTGEDVANVELLDWRDAVEEAPTQAEMDAEWLAILQERAAQEAEEAVRASAEGAFGGLPGWASWTAAEAENHINTNVTDLASAKVVLRAMAKAIVALRNDRWPGLQGRG